MRHKDIEKQEEHTHVSIAKEEKSKTIAISRKSINTRERRTILLNCTDYIIYTH